MLSSLKNRLYAVYLDIISSIAFYPTVISISFLILAIGLLSFEDDAMTKFLINNMSFLVIDNAETARSILSTLIGGLISLTVFSFSMVMVLLNQASSNFSPRLLPGLISDKRNQIVLGTYLGTIIYNIIVLISILPKGDKYTLNGFSILVGILLGIVCLAMFVFFIHTISTGIQINNILNKIFVQTKSRLLQLIDRERVEINEVYDKSNWKTINSQEAGYYQGVNLEDLKSFIDEKKINIHVAPYKGQYILPNSPLLKYDNEIDEQTKKALVEYFIFSTSHNVTENYVLGIKQITEVGVKAMSPGINDPGTAVMTLDYLTELLALRMKIKEKEIYFSESEEFSIELNILSFKDLIYQSMAAYRQYCKHDLILMEKLGAMLVYLTKQEYKEDSYAEVLAEQIDILCADVNNNIENKTDLKQFEDLIIG